MTASSSPRIILHGGAGPWKKDNHIEVLDGMKQAAAAAWTVLQNGGSALDAVEKGTRTLEDHPLFDAGVGSFLNDHGEVEMDALITDGRDRNFGAVAAVQHIQHPITLARLVMEKTPHRFFVATGAEALAQKHNIPLVSNLSFVTAEEFAAFQERNAGTLTQEAGHGTVGAVAIDSNGYIASATSTGGSPNKMQGRIGDVPIYGAGGYADNAVGGASATGIGENIMRYLLSRYTVDLMAAGTAPLDAAQNAVAEVARNIDTPEIGIIVLNQDGQLGAAHTTAHMPIAWVTPEGDVRAQMKAPYTLG